MLEGCSDVQPTSRHTPRLWTVVRVRGFLGWKKRPGFNNYTVALHTFTAIPLNNSKPHIWNKNSFLSQNYPKVLSCDALSSNCNPDPKKCIMYFSVLAACISCAEMQVFLQSSWHPGPWLVAAGVCLEQWPSVCKTWVGTMTQHDAYGTQTDSK